MSAICSLTFSITTGFVKKFLRTIRHKKKKQNEIVMLARIKLNSIEDFMTIMNKEKKFQQQKESIRMMNSQRSSVEKISLIEEGEKIGINEVIKHN